MKYRIVHVTRNEHSQAFSGVGELFMQTLLDLDYDCDISLKLSRDRHNLIVGANQVDCYCYMPEGIEYSILQLEQLPGKWWNANYSNLLHGAYEVFDYDPSNLVFLAKNNIRARQITLGYHPHLDCIPPMPKQIDVLFYGSLNERRRRVLEECRRLGLHVQEVFGIYGRDRDMLIAQSRVVLNMHFYEEQLFEQVRVSYLLNNGANVVSESSDYNPYWNVPFTTAPYYRLAEACKRAIDDGCDGRAAQAVFREKYNFREILREAMRETVHQPAQRR